jgi:hypothetical protein
MPARYPIPALQRALAYDPGEGLLTWRRPTGPRVRAGDEAGTLRADGRVFVSLKGRLYAAQDLCWALAKGEYPPAPLTFRDHDPSNLKLDNLALGGTTSRATEQEEALAAARARDTPEIPVPDVKRSFVDGVYWQDESIIRGQRTPRGWAVRVMRRSSMGINNWSVAASGLTLEAAEAMKRELDINEAWLSTHPPRELTDAERHIRTTLRGPMLGELYDTFAYFPETGAILRRHPAEFAFRADYVEENGLRVVPYRSRYYSARRLAWFLHRHEWLDARLIAYRSTPDPARNDENRWANLVSVEQLIAESLDTESPPPLNPAPRRRARTFSDA